MNLSTVTSTSINYEISNSAMLYFEPPVGLSIDYRIQIVVGLTLGRPSLAFFLSLFPQCFLLSLRTQNRTVLRSLCLSFPLGPSAPCLRSPRALCSLVGYGLQSWVTPAYTARSSAGRQARLQRLAQSHDSHGVLMGRYTDSEYL